MVRNKLLRSKKPGSVMALVLFAVILLLLSGMGVLSLGQNTRIFSIRTAAEIVARSAADDGITKALWQLNWNLEDGWAKYPLPYENLTELPNCNGATYSYVVIKSSDYYGGMMPSGDAGLIDFVGSAYPTKAPGGGDYVVRSIGRYNGAEKVIYATLRMRGAGDECVIVRDALTLKEGTWVDGRDSRDPTNLNPDVLTEIGTTSADASKVTLNNGVTVDGNILVGVDGDPATVIKGLQNATVTGDMYAMIEEPEFPYIDPPALPDKRPKKIEIGNKDDPNFYIDETWNGIYNMIDLDTGAVGKERPENLIIKTGNDVVLYLTNTGTGVSKASISLGRDCGIIIENGATLNLYVAGNILSNTGSGFNNLGTPPQLKLWGNWTESTPTTGPCQNWQLNAKSAYFGQIYAPAASVQVNNGNNLYGAFTAYDFTTMNGGNLYYDGALREVDPTKDPAVRFVLMRWYEQ